MMDRNMERPLSPTQLAIRWKCSANTVRNLVAQGKLPAKRVGPNLDPDPAQLDHGDRKMSPINIGKLKGRYVVYWYEEPGVEKSRRRFRLNASNKAEAWAEGRRVYESQLALKGNKLTFEDIWKRYRRYLGDRRTGSELDSVWKTVGPALKQYHPLQIDDDVVSDYLEDRRKNLSRKTGGRRRRTLFMGRSI
ncbi:hypothetical protein [Pacificitalea manganoxidans]|uniref:hypothetical protein n=1 Tax=Pacificitalea manganoxidans TaxID=1411902 RepID=UPI0012FE52C1|nr:hypothetical protein [Pacificitalea manganoxidans]MDR6308125.1 hypothetical protein [Pacificitalea manganoxidans]